MLVSLLDPWIIGAPRADDETTLGFIEVPGCVGVEVFGSRLVESGDLAPDRTTGNPPAKDRSVVELRVVVEDWRFSVWV